MKPLIATLAGLMALSAAADVTINFNNNVTGCVRSPVYGPEPGDPTVSKAGNTVSGLPSGTQTYSGGLLSGAHCRAQLFFAPGFMSEVPLPAGPSTTFRSGGGAGYVTPTLLPVPLSLGSSGTFQLRAWEDPICG